MSADVRIKIEDYKGAPAAMEYKVLFIMLGFTRHTTEDALIRL